MNLESIRLLTGDLVRQSIAQAFRNLLSGNIRADFDFWSQLEWEGFLPLCHRHMLSARLYRQLAETGLLEAIPPFALERIKAAYFHSLQMHALTEKQVPVLLRGFEARKIPVMFIKGWALAKRYYLHPEERMFADLDLLFHDDDRQAVEAFFIENGYERAREREGHAHKPEFRLMENAGFTVKCHFGLGYGKYRFTNVWLGSQVTRIKTAEGSFVIRHLSYYDEYLYLIFHAGVQHRFQRLFWLLDLAHMRAKKFDALTDSKFMAEILEMAKPRGLEHSLRFAEYFLTRAGALGWLGTDKTDRMLESWFERIASGSIESSRWQRARLRTLLQDNWYRVFIYALKRSFGRHETPEKNKAV